MFYTVVARFGQDMFRELLVVADHERRRLTVTRCPPIEFVVTEDLDFTNNMNRGLTSTRRDEE